MPRHTRSPPLGHADLSIDAILADDDSVGALRVEDGSRVLRIERLMHDEAGTPSRPRDAGHATVRRSRVPLAQRGVERSDDGPPVSAIRLPVSRSLPPSTA
ncbi:hypothetical protein WT11_16520 [Burkholderia stagnalis]|nr:hypothetical protein WT11_16520 [Burkholderia stagnalis]